MTSIGFKCHGNKRCGSEKNALHCDSRQFSQAFKRSTQLVQSIESKLFPLLKKTQFQLPKTRFNFHSKKQIQPKNIFVNYNQIFQDKQKKIVSICDKVKMQAQSIKILQRDPKLKKKLQIQQIQQIKYIENSLFNIELFKQNFRNCYLQTIENIKVKNQKKDQIYEQTNQNQLRQHQSIQRQEGSIILQLNENNSISNTDQDKRQLSVSEKLKERYMKIKQQIEQSRINSLNIQSESQNKIKFQQQKSHSSNSKKQIHQERRKSKSNIIKQFPQNNELQKDNTQIQFKQENKDLQGHIKENQTQHPIILKQTIQQKENMDYLYPTYMNEFKQFIENNIVKNEQQQSIEFINQSQSKIKQRPHQALDEAQQMLDETQQTIEKLNKQTQLQIGTLASKMRYNSIQLINQSQVIQPLAQIGILTSKKCIEQNIENQQLEADAVQTIDQLTKQTLQTQIGTLTSNKFIVQNIEKQQMADNARQTTLIKQPLLTQIGIQQNITQSLQIGTLTSKKKIEQRQMADDVMQTVGQLTIPTQSVQIGTLTSKKKIEKQHMADDAIHTVEQLIKQAQSLQKGTLTSKKQIEKQHIFDHPLQPIDQSFSESDKISPQATKRRLPQKLQYPSQINTQTAQEYQKQKNSPQQMTDNAIRTTDDKLLIKQPLVFSKKTQDETIQPVVQQLQNQHKQLNNKNDQTQTIQPTGIHYLQQQSAQKNYSSSQIKTDAQISQMFQKQVQKIRKNLNLVDQETNNKITKIQTPLKQSSAKQQQFNLLDTPKNIHPQYFFQGILQQLSSSKKLQISSLSPQKKKLNQRMLQIRHKIENSHQKQKIKANPAKCVVYRLKDYSDLLQVSKYSKFLLKFQSDKQILLLDVILMPLDSLIDCKYMIFELQIYEQDQKLLVKPYKLSHRNIKTKHVLQMSEAIPIKAKVRYTIAIQFCVGKGMFRLPQHAITRDGGIQMSSDCRKHELIEGMIFQKGL